MKFYRGLAAFLRVFLKIFFRIDLEGTQYAVEDKGLICSNHISNWDPVFISAFYPHPIHWMAKEELFHNPLLGKILQTLGAFPVKREKNDLAALKKSLRMMKEGKNIGIFPEGTRVKEKGQVQAKSGVGLLALKTGGLVSPITISGNYRIFSKVKITIHPPMEAKALTSPSLKGEEAYQEAAMRIMEEIYRER